MSEVAEWDVCSATPRSKRRRGFRGAAQAPSVAHAHALEPRTLLAFTPLGEPLFANTTFRASDSHAVVATDADGDFVVAWERRAPSDGAGDVFARRFGADFLPKGDEFQVNTPAFGDHKGVRVAMDADGDFVIAWYTERPTNDVSARRFSAAGVPVGPEFHPAVPAASANQQPSVAMDANGNFVIAWPAYVSPRPEVPSSIRRVYAQRYAADGSPRSAPTRIGVMEQFLPEMDPAIAADAEGNFVVTWADASPDPELRVASRRFDATGQPVGPVEVVADGFRHLDIAPAVAMDRDGDFLIAWNNAEPNANLAFARRYDRSGSPQGGPVRLNPEPSLAPVSVSLAMHAEGDAVAAWPILPSLSQPGPTDFVEGRLLRASGGMEEPFTIARSSLDWSAPGQPALAIDGEGDHDANK